MTFPRRIPSLFAVLCTASSLQAATLYWDGAGTTADADGGSGTWNTTLTNWDTSATAGTDSAFAAGDNAVFGGAAGTITLGSSITAGTVTFNTAGYTLNTGSNYTLSLTGFAGAGGFTKAGTGTLTLSGYTRTGMAMSGGITVDAGTLVFGTSVWNGAGSGSAWASPLTITVNSGAQLKTDGAHHLGTTTNVTLNSGGSYYQTGDNYHMGTWTLNGGSITGNTGNYRLSSGYQLNVTEDSTISNVIFVSYFANAPINVVAGKTLNQSAVLGVNGGSFRKQGAGTWVINNTSTSNNIGGLTIDAGTFRVAGSAALGSSGSYSGTLTNNGVFQYASTAVQTVSSAITGSGAVIVDSGSLTLSGNNTYAGTTTVNGGTLRLSGTNASTITVNNGGTLNVATTASTAGLLTMNAGATLAADASTTNAFTSNGVNFAGATTLTFSSTLTSGSTYSVLDYGAGGVTNFANLAAKARGMLTDDSANSRITFTAGTAGTRTWNTTSGTWDNLTTANFSEGDHMFSSGDAVVFNDPASASVVTLAGQLAPASVSVNNTANTYTFSGSGSITGSGTLAKSGSGGLQIATANTYSGGTMLSGTGYVTAVSASAFGSGTIKVTGGTSTLHAAGLTIANDIRIDDGAALTLNFSRNTNGSGNGDVTYSGAISSGTTGALSVVNSGTPTSINFNGSLSSFLGSITTDSQAGNINFTSASSGLGSANAAFTVNGTGSFSTAVGASTSSTFDMGSLAGSGKLSVKGTLSVGNLNTDTTFSGVIANNTSGALVKVGSGTLTLSGVNTYSGGTTLSGGKIVTGNGAALGSGAVTVAGGTLQVGATNLAGIASLTVNTGSLDTTLGKVTTTGAFALAGGTWVIGDTADAITAGSFTLTAGVIDLTGFTNKSNAGTYSLISGTGSSSFTDANFANGDAGFSYSIDGNGDLLVTAVPEPSTYGLLGAGALAAAALVRRRRKIKA